jgi:hypothetical protein
MGERRMSSRQGCNPAGESPAASVTCRGRVVMPFLGGTTIGGTKQVGREGRLARRKRGRGRGIRFQNVRKDHSAAAPRVAFPAEQGDLESGHGT